jgi:hypothetical protein
MWKACGDFWIRELRASREVGADYRVLVEWEHRNQRKSPCLATEAKSLNRRGTTEEHGENL